MQGETNHVHKPRISTSNVTPPPFATCQSQFQPAIELLLTFGAKINKQVLAHWYLMWLCKIHIYIYIVVISICITHQLLSGWKNSALIKHRRLCYCYQSWWLKKKSKIQKFKYLKQNFPQHRTSMETLHCTLLLQKVREMMVDLFQSTSLRKEQMFHKECTWINSLRSKGSVMLPLGTISLNAIQRKCIERGYCGTAVQEVFCWLELTLFCTS